jgi:hypothetical protein
MKVRLLHLLLLLRLLLRLLLLLLLHLLLLLRLFWKSLDESRIIACPLTRTTRQVVRR